MHAHECLILNGKQCANEALRAAVMQRREQGHRLDVRVTWEAGDAMRYAHEALEHGCTRVIAAGGDGTLRAVAHVLAEAADAASLGIVPLGTANDFATAAGIPLEPAQALALLDRTPVAVDVAEVNGECFLNMATGGFGSQITNATPDELKKVLGGVAYFLTGLTRFSEVHSAFGRFRGPDFQWEGDFLALGIGNGRQAGGGHLLCPQAYLNDGLLDISIIPAPQDFGGTLSTLLTGGILGLEHICVQARVAELSIEAEDGLGLNLDGEPLESNHMRVRVLPGALRLHLPDACPLLLS